MVHFTSFWFGFVVVWWLRCSVKFPETSELNFRNVDAELLIFHFNGFGPLTSFFSLHCHGLMDFELTSWFGFGNFTPDANFSWQMWWTSTSFFGGGTPDALTGKLRFFQPGKLRDDLTLLEILGEIPLLLLWAWGETSKADLLAGKRTRCWGEKTSAKALGLLAKVARGSNLSFEVGNFEGAYTWTALQCGTTSRVLLEVVWGRDRTSSQKVSTLSPQPRTSTSRVGPQTGTSFETLNFEMALQGQRNMVTCDNPLWIACMWNQEHLLAFWLGRTLSYVPLQGTLMRDQLPALFPYLFGGRPTSLPRPIYTPQEHFIYTQVYEAAHFTPRLPSQCPGCTLHSVGTFHCKSILHREVQGIIQCLTSIPLDSKAEHLPPANRTLPFLPRFSPKRGRWTCGERWLHTSNGSCTSSCPTTSSTLTSRWMVVNFSEDFFKWSLFWLLCEKADNSCFTSGFLQDFFFIAALD